jgi:hypothetical protein
LPRGGHALDVYELRDTEVGELHAAVLVEQHVLGLHIAVDHALCMRGAQRARDLERHARGDLRRDLGLILGELFERRAGEQLGRDEADLGALAAVVVDLEDARMAQARDRHGLTREAVARFRCALQMGMHHLERDEPVQACVARAIDRSHAAMADLVDDFILLDRLEHRTPGGTPADRS